MTNVRPPVHLLDSRDVIADALRERLANRRSDAETLLAFKDAFRALPDAVQNRLTFADFLFHLLEFQENYGISFKLEPHPSFLQALTRMTPSA